METLEQLKETYDATGNIDGIQFIRLQYDLINKEDKKGLDELMNFIAYVANNETEYDQFLISITRAGFYEA